MAQEALEVTLTQIPQCFVYKLGPRPSAKGYMCKDWLPEDHIWTGKVIILGKGQQCIVKLEDPKTGQLFAACPVTENGPGSIERALDSSRYFIVRLDDGKGHYAFIGIGFENREEGFDFQHTISEHFRRVNAGAEETKKIDPDAYKLKEGQKIKFDFKLKKGEGAEQKPKVEKKAPSGNYSFPSPDFDDESDINLSNTTSTSTPSSSPPPTKPASQPNSGFDFFGIGGNTTTTTTTAKPISNPPQSFLQPPQAKQTQQFQAANFSSSPFFASPAPAPAPAPANNAFFTPSFNTTPTTSPSVNLGASSGSAGVDLLQMFSIPSSSPQPSPQPQPNANPFGFSFNAPPPQQQRPAQPVNNYWGQPNPTPSTNAGGSAPGASIDLNSLPW